MTYREFFTDLRKQGKTPQEISILWTQHKASLKQDAAKN